MAEHILVVGGAGFIGSHLVDSLLNEGHEVRVLDSLEAQVHGIGEEPPPYLHPEAELLRGSILDREAVGQALDGIDVVYHQAALVGVGQSMYDIGRYCEVNTIGTATLLEELVRRRHRVRKLVVASSMSLYGEGACAGPAGPAYPKMRSRQALLAQDWEPRDEATGEQLVGVPTGEDKPLSPNSVYAITKRDQEELSLSVGAAYQIPTVALRYFNVYGRRQALSNPYTGVAAIFSSRVLNGKCPIVFEDGRQSRDFVHVEDVVQANLLALDTPAADFRALNVGTGHSTTMLDLAHAICAHLGRSDLEPEVTETFREGDIRHCVADVTLAQRLLGYNPKVAFRDGIHDLLEWVRDQPATDHFDRAHRELTSRGLA